MDADLHRGDPSASPVLSVGFLRGRLLTLPNETDSLAPHEMQQDRQPSCHNDLGLFEAFGLPPRLWTP